MNKFTIEADGEKVEVELVRLESGGGNKLIIGGFTLAFYRYADEFFDILRKAYYQSAEYKDLSESYEQLREAHEAMTAERDDLRLQVFDWKNRFLGSKLEPTPPQPAKYGLTAEEAGANMQAFAIAVNAQREQPTPPQPARKIVQVSGEYALCNDGTMWYLGAHNDWNLLPPIPQETPCD
jgi:hypothetical protein